MSLEKAKELIAGIEDLPTLPEVVIEITRLVEDPDATAADIQKLVATDPALAATMLKLVNSAFYGIRRSVTSLDEAVKILGFVTVGNIALAAFVFDAFVTGEKRFNYREFWLHCIGTAAAAKVVARRLQVKEVAEYFVFGLLHDLGVIVRMQYFPDEHAQIADLVSQGKDLAEAEAEVDGYAHKDLGAALAERWQFPGCLAAVIGRHGTSDIPEDCSCEVAVTTCADAVAEALELGEGHSERAMLVDEATWQAAGISPEQMGSIMDETLDEMENYRAFMNLLD